MTPGVSVSAIATTSPGNPPPDAEIDPTLRPGRELDDLQAVGDVPGPELRQGRRCYELHGFLPTQQECSEFVKAGQRFT